MIEDGERKGCMERTEGERLFELEKIKGAKTSELLLR